MSPDATVVTFFTLIWTYSSGWGNNVTVQHMPIGRIIWKNNL